ncbi:MAG: acyl-CoA dehydratase activase-related protein [Bacilli bacterium]
MKIGIPNALLHYKYKDLILTFLDTLNVDYIVSPSTNRSISENGFKLSQSEACLSSKIYLGHVDYLKDKCDAILIIRLDCIKENEEVCTRFSAIYDLTKYSIENVKLIDLNITIDEETSFIKLGETLGFSKIVSKESYKFAKTKQKAKENEKLQKQLEKIKDDNLKILLVSHDYNTYDEMIGKPILKYLKDNNITVLFSENYEDKYKEEYKNISKNLYFSHNIKQLNGIGAYKDYVDGIILITTFPCGTDSLVNEMVIRTIKDKPIINIILDENTAEAGLITRLESFLDILTLKRKEVKI